MVKLKKFKKFIAFMLVTVLAISGVDLSALASDYEEPSPPDSIAVGIVLRNNTNAFDEEPILEIPIGFDIDGSSYYAKRNNLESIQLKIQREISSKDILLGCCENIALRNSYVISFERKLSDYYKSYYLLWAKGIDGSKADLNTILKYRDEFLNDERFYVEIRYKNGKTYCVNLKFVIKDEGSTPYLGSKKMYYDATYLDSTEYLVSVPSSKTVGDDSDFYRDNAIVAVSSGSIYNTYYVDKDSKYNIKIPLNDMSAYTSVSKVSFGDKRVYNNKHSVTINTDSTDLDGTDLDTGDSKYVLYTTDKFRRLTTNGEFFDNTDDIRELLKKTLRVDTVNIDGEDVDLLDTDIPISDIISKGRVSIPTKHIGLFGHEDEYVGDNTRYTNYLETYERVQNEYKAKIVFSEVPKIGDLISETDKFKYLQPKISYNYIDDDYKVYNYNDDYNVSSFYTDKDVDLKGYSKGVIKSIDKTKLVDYYSNGVKGFIKIPCDSTAVNVISDLYNIGNGCEDWMNYQLLQAYVEVSSGQHWRDNYSYGLGSFTSNLYGYMSNTSKLNDLNYNGYVYIAYNPLKPNVESHLIRTLNTRYGKSFSNIQQVVDSEFGVSGYTFTSPVTSSSDVNMTYYRAFSIFGSDDREFTSYENAMSRYNSVCLTDGNTLTVSVPEFALTTWYRCDSALNFVPSGGSSAGNKYLFQNIFDTAVTDCLYTYTCDNYRDSYTINELIEQGVLDKNFDYNKISCTGMSCWNCDYGKYIYKLDELSVLNGTDFANLRIEINMSYDSANYTLLKPAEYSDDMKLLISTLEKYGCKIDYKKSYMPDFYSNNIKLSDYMSLDEVNSILNNFVDDNNGNIYLDMCTKANCASSVSSDTYDSSLNSSINDDILSIPVPNDLSKGDYKDINMQVVDVYAWGNDYHDVTVKNAMKANFASVHGGNHKFDDGSFKFKNVSYILNGNSLYLWGTFIDYKFGNIVLASKPDSVSNLSVASNGAIEWTEPTDIGLGEGKSDDIIKLGSYKIEVIDNKGKILYSGTTEFTNFDLPNECLVGGTRAKVYAVNVIGESVGVSINLPKLYEPTPSVTTQPSVTVSPTAIVTTKPSVTVSPTAVVTQRPVVTTQPSITATPTAIVTIQPSMTSSPVVTETPVITPTVSQEPTFTVTDEPTKVPIETSVPTLEPIVTPLVTTEPSSEVPIETSVPTLDPIVTPLVTTEPTKVPVLESTAVPSPIESVEEPIDTLKKVKIKLGVGEKYALPFKGSSTTYDISNKKVISLNKKGKVTAKSVGKSKIVVINADGSSDIYTVTVKKAPKSVSLTTPNKFIKIGNKVKLNVSFPKGCFSNKKVFSVSNKKIATVNKNGVLKAKSAGVCKVTVKTYNNKRCTVKIIVK